MSSTIMSSGHYRRSRRLSKITRRLRVHSRHEATLKIQLMAEWIWSQETGVRIILWFSYTEY